MLLLPYDKQRGKLIDVALAELLVTSDCFTGLTTLHPAGICLVASAVGSYKLCKLTHVTIEYSC